MNEPNIQVFNVDVRGDRSLTMRHVRQDRKPLEKESAEEVLKHLRRLWKFDVILESAQDDIVVETFECRANGTDIHNTSDDPELTLIQQI